MQIILLIVNFFLITIISREYGAEIYGEYASAKSLSVLLGTAIVLSLALVVTRTSSNIEKFDKNLFYTTYKTIIRNTILASVLVVPLSAIFGRNYPLRNLNPTIPKQGGHRSERVPPLCHQLKDLSSLD